MFVTNISYEIDLRVIIVRATYNIQMLNKICALREHDGSHIHIRSNVT